MADFEGWCHRDEITGAALGHDGIIGPSCRITVGYETCGARITRDGDAIPQLATPRSFTWRQPAGAVDAKTGLVFIGFQHVAV